MRRAWGKGQCYDLLIHVMQAGRSNYLISHAPLLSTSQAILSTHSLAVTSKHWLSARLRLI